MDTLREETQEAEAPETEAVDQQEEIQQEPEQQEPAEVSADEQQARDKGWVDLEEWKEQGKDPADWGGYRAFNKNGSILAQKYANERKHQEEIQNLNQYHKVQLESRIKELESKRMDAVEMADTDAYKQAQGEIDELQKQQAQIQKQSQPEISQADQQIENEWQNNNKWYNGNDPKGVIARDAANRNLHLTGQEFIDAIEREVSKAFPQVNQNRQRPSMTEKSTPRTVKSEKPTMDSLTADERKAWNNFSGNKHMTEAKFLKAVENSRKGK